MDGKQRAGATPVPGRRPEQRPTVRAGLLITCLIALGLVPILANTLRRIALSLGTVEGFTDNGSPDVPLPVAVHVLTATIFVILGSFQFSPGFRRRKPVWHRIAGRVLVVVGMLVALSGLWLNQFVSFPAGSGELLYVFRWLAGLGMAFCIVIGFAAVRRRDIPRHRQWMIRAYALGLGAGTQVFTLGFGEAILGKTALNVALLNGAGWVINLAVAEWAIRRQRPRDPAARESTQVRVP
ncbi:DUF2306 domain-containing protein [Arthrobacter sp. RT-1]|uniref:DUF2306 domain-containing protein n=1 Tax=Arthrobacter sp. RT-1 TaxID=2292263 RepID=UPI000E1EBA92|nr:DUF2306 domain-containing protein [Arthrobacter sp. RT-1]RDV10417.1 DUF2306 domain-containing protein [Arthrobacter sp. RT-1]